MDQNAEELHRLWEEIRQGPTTSCSSITTEIHSDSHSNLSTPSLISDLDLPSPLSAFSVEIEDIFNFELDEVLPPSPSETELPVSEAAFKPISTPGEHNANYANITVEDTTSTISTSSNTGTWLKEGPDTTTPSGEKEVDLFSLSPEVKTTKIQPKDGRKRPLSPSVTHNGPNQKTRRIDNTTTRKPSRLKSTEEKKSIPHYRPPPLLRLRVKPTPALAERLTQSGYLPLKKRKYPRKNR